MSNSNGENIKAVSPAEGGRLNAYLLHEVRNQVANLGLALEQIAMTEGADAARLANAALQTYSDTTILLNSGLDLASLQAGNFRFGEAAIRKMVNDVANTVNCGAGGRKHIALTVSVAADLPVTFETDIMRTKQVLLNLLLNAVKFSAEGGRVHLMVCRMGERNRVGFCVKDRGPGMSQQTCQSLFNPFVQAEETRTKVSGTGLGLYISRLIVEALGGIIGVDSKEGEGSTFYFELPLALARGVKVRTAGSV
jgi:signal transduction histidine kinase